MKNGPYLLGWTVICLSIDLFRQVSMKTEKFYIINHLNTEVIFSKQKKRIVSPFILGHWGLFGIGAAFTYHPIVA